MRSCRKRPEQRSGCAHQTGLGLTLPNGRLQHFTPPASVHRPDAQTVHVEHVRVDKDSDPHQAPLASAIPQLRFGCGDADVINLLFSLHHHLRLGVLVHRNLKAP